jgi:hypothetical protein
MGYLRRLIETHPFHTQVPNLSPIAMEQTRPWEMCLALRGDGFALIYTPTGRTLDIRTEKVALTKGAASWFDPRTGVVAPIGNVERTGTRTFDPPGDETHGNDWVLVLE